MPALKQSIIIWLLLLMSFNFISAQETAVDNWLDKSRKFHEKSELDSSWSYSIKAENLSRSKNYTKGILHAKIIQANLQIEWDELGKAEINAKEVIKLARQIHDKFAEAVGYMQLGQVKLYSNEMEQALPYFEKSIQGYFSKNPSPEAALAYNDYGYTLGKLGKLEMQAENLLVALRIHEKLTPINNSEMAIVLNNLSTVYLELRQSEKAIDYAKQSLIYRKKAGNVDQLALGYCNISQMYRGVDLGEAEKYRKLCVDFSEQSGNETRLMQSYITSALIFSDKKDLDSAMKFEQKAINILEKNKNHPMMLSRRYLAMSMHAISLKKDSTEILNYLGKSKNLALESQDKVTLREINYQYYVFYKDQQNFEKSLESYQIFNRYRDSIINENTKANIAELETKYNTEKKDNQIVQLYTDQRIKQLQIEKQEALIAGNLLEAKQKEKEIQILSQEKELQDLRISKQNEELEKQQLITLSNMQKLQLAEKEKIIQDRKLRNSRSVQYLTFASIGLLFVLTFFLFNRYQLKRKLKEQKKLLDIRENIAKDLHDEIGSTLTSIKILSEVSDKRIKKQQPEISEFLNKITEQSAMAQQSISDIVWSVKPGNDSFENMIIRMREYIAQTLEVKNIQTTILFDENLQGNSLRTEFRRDFLMIFKEAINNIAKHSSATEVSIGLKELNKMILMEITDNGKGFDPDLSSNRNGLKNMQNRAEFLNAKLDIRSKINQGTKIELLLKTT